MGVPGPWDFFTSISGVISDPTEITVCFGPTWKSPFRHLFWGGEKKNATSPENYQMSTLKNRWKEDEILLKVAPFLKGNIRSFFAGGGWCT